MLPDCRNAEDKEDHHTVSGTHWPLSLTERHERNVHVSLTTQHEVNMHGYRTHDHAKHIQVMVDHEFRPTCSVAVLEAPSLVSKATLVALLLRGTSLGRKDLQVKTTWPTDGNGLHCHVIQIG